jgi:single-strand DNA-binding protein
MARTKRTEAVACQRQANQNEGIQHMSDINGVSLCGRLVKDPIVQRSGSGVFWATFTLAANRRFKAKNGEAEEEVAFVPAKAFGRWAESLEGRLKGETAIVTGRLRTETWQSESAARSQLVLLCDTVYFVATANGHGPAGVSSEPEPHAIAGGNGHDGKPPF